MVIDQVEESDAGRYTCTPYNILGTQGESTESRLIIRNPPYFTLPPSEKYEAEIGKELVVPCQGAGDPPPHVFWTKVRDLINYATVFPKFCAARQPKAGHQIFIYRNSIKNV